MSAREIGVLLIGVFLLAAVGWFAAGSLGVVPLPGESAAAFHLRLLERHGKDDKDMAMQAYHARQLLAQGDDGVETLLSAIAVGGAGPRYERHTPGKRELAMALGLPMRKRLNELLDQDDRKDAARFGRLLSVYFVCFASRDEIRATLQEFDGGDTEFDRAAWNTVTEDLMFPAKMFPLDTDKSRDSFLEKLLDSRESVRSRMVFVGE